MFFHVLFQPPYPLQIHNNLSLGQFYFKTALGLIMYLSCILSSIVHEESSIIVNIIFVTVEWNWIMPVILLAAQYSCCFINTSHRLTHTKTRHPK